MTDLEAHRERNRQIPDEIREQIKAQGVEFVYYQTVTLSGRIMAKVSPVDQLERNLRSGVFMHRSAVADFQTTLAGELLGGGAQAAEFNAMPDLDTFSVLPWDTRTARFLCTLYEPAHMPDVGGSYFASDPRGHFHRMHKAFRDETGLELRSGCEPEMTWIGEGLEVISKPGQGPSYHFEQLERTREIYIRVMRYAQAMGFTMIEGDYEDAGQLELNWMYDSAEKTADRLVTYRMICAQVARELGVVASFMPKPFQGSMGSGCHHNLSLWRGDTNLLVDPEKQELHVSEEGRHILGGILGHATSAMAVMASTVNSYKRYADAGQFAPSVVNWGLDDRTCSVRVPAIGRLEFKLPDAAVNPYLSHSLLLAAVRDGMDRMLDPDDVADCVLPKSLGEALHRLREDKVLWDALSPDMAELYVALKSDEWNRYCAAVTDWEREQYLDTLP